TRDLHAIVEQSQLILRENCVTSLRYIDVGIIGRIDLKRRVLEIFILKLVAARDEVVLSGLHVDTRVERVNLCVKVRSRSAAEWLKSDAEWPIDAAAVCHETLVTDRVSEGLSGTLCENNRAVEEV